MHRFAVLVICGVTATLAAQQPDAAFEVASIKINTAGGPIGPQTVTPDGHISLINTAVGPLIARAYPDLTVPIQILNLPSWAGSDRFDVVARSKAGASVEDVPQMLRTLLAQRMKLVTHYETREQPGYALTFARADKTLGPGIKPSSLNCGVAAPLLAAPQEAADPKTASLRRCGAFWVEGDSVLSGGATLNELGRVVTSAAGGPVTNATGLTGYFEIVVRYQRTRSIPAADSNATSVFTAVQEQLGLKLKPAPIQGRILVIDAVERPTPD
jgi:uncharacterized protein (TIGR03435 family)